MTIPMSALALALALDAPPAARADEWPGLRGPHHDGSASGSGFPGGEGTLAMRWRQAIGRGYSGVAVSGGRAVTLHTDGADDVMAAHDVESGRRLWRMVIGPAHPGLDGSFGGPISTPAVHGGRVFALGPRGQLVAADLATGREAWRANVAEREGAKTPHYGFATSPVVADGVLVVQVGAGDGRALAGFDPATGERRWTAGGDAVQYQSPVVVGAGGRPIVVAVGDTNVLGLDPATGRVLFTHPHGGTSHDIAGGSAVPVPAGDDRLFVKTHLDKSTMFRLVAGEGGALRLETLWTAPVLRTTYVVPVYHQGHLYGMTGRTTLTCVDAATGEVKWRSREPGDGFPTLAGGDLVVLTKERTLHVGAASPSGWKERARLEVFADGLAWTAPSVVGRSVFARSHGQLARVDWTGAAAKAEAAAGVASPVLARFLDEIARAADKHAVVDRLLAAAPDGPLVDPPDRVVFLYRGPAKDVGISSDLIGMRREDPLRRVDGTDLFYYEARVEPGARVSYQFVADFGPPAADPRNPRKVPWMTPTDASSLEMPGWTAPAHLADPPPERRGRMETVEFAAAARPGAKATLHVYLPAGHDASERRYPSAYFIDGDGAREGGRVPQTLDNVAPDRASPAILVFLGRFSWGDWKPRGDEAAKAANELLVKEIVPLIDGKYRTVAEPRARAVVAQGFSALAALFAAFGEPGLFGAVGVQSVGMLDSDEAELVPLVKTAAERPLRVYHDWTSYDLRSTRENADTRIANRRLHALLREKGYRPEGGEAKDGTGWASWRNRTDALLATLFPPRP